MIQVYETGFSITCRRQYSLITNNSQKFGNRDFDRIEAIASINVYSFIIKNQFFVLKFLRQLKKKNKNVAVISLPKECSLLFSKETLVTVSQYI